MVTIIMRRTVRSFLGL